MIWQILIGLGMMILGYIIMPKPKATKPDEVTEMEAPTAEAGRPIPVLFGEVNIKSPNFLWWGDKEFIERNVKNSKKKS